jgi:hypothetical protein
MRKEFTKFGIIITRDDFADKMCSADLTDKQMRKLVDRVAQNLQTKFGYTKKEMKTYFLDNYLVESELFTQRLYELIEIIAVSFGIRYIKDLTMTEYIKYLSKVEQLYERENTEIYNEQLLCFC